MQARAAQGLDSASENPYRVQGRGGGKKELLNNIYNAIFNAGITFKTRGRVGPR